MNGKTELDKADRASFNKITSDYWDIMQYNSPGHVSKRNEYIQYMDSYKPKLSTKEDIAVYQQYVKYMNKTYSPESIGAYKNASPLIGQTMLPGVESASNLAEYSSAIKGKPPYDNEILQGIAIYGSKPQRPMTFQQYAAFEPMRRNIREVSKDFNLTERDIFEPFIWSTKKAGQTYDVIDALSLSKNVREKTKALGQSKYIKPTIDKYHINNLDPGALKWAGRTVSWLGSAFTVGEGIDNVIAAKKEKNLYTKIYQGTLGQWQIAGGGASVIPPLGVVPSLLGGLNARNTANRAVKDIGRTIVTSKRENGEIRKSTHLGYKDQIINTIQKDDLKGTGLIKLDEEHPGLIATFIHDEGIYAPNLKKAINAGKLQRRDEYTPDIVKRGYRDQHHERSGPSKAKILGSSNSTKYGWSIGAKGLTLAYMGYAAIKMANKKASYGTSKSKPKPKAKTSIWSSIAAWARKAIKKHATGGLVAGGSQLTTVAEEGTPEMIIPLGAHRRQRGVELWERAGEMMGMKGLAEGGKVMGGRAIAGGSRSSVNAGGAGSKTSGAQGEDVMKIVRANMGDFAEEVAGTLNTVIGGQYTNTPN